MSAIAEPPSDAPTPRRRNASPRGVARERAAHATEAQRAARALDVEECRCELVPKSHASQAQMDSYLNEIDAGPCVRFAANVLGVQKCYHTSSRYCAMPLEEFMEVLLLANPKDMKERVASGKLGPTVLPVRDTPQETRAAREELYAKRAVARVGLFHPQDVEQTRDVAEAPQLSPQEAESLRRRDALAGARVKLRLSMEAEEGDCDVQA